MRPHNQKQYRSPEPRTREPGDRGTQTGLRKETFWASSAPTVGAAAAAALVQSLILSRLFPLMSLNSRQNNSVYSCVYFTRDENKTINSRKDLMLIFFFF